MNPKRLSAALKLAAILRRSKALVNSDGVNSKQKETRKMTTVNQQKEMFYSAAILSNIAMLAAKVGRTYDFEYLTTC